MVPAFVSEGHCAKIPYDYLDTWTGQLRPASCKAIRCPVCGPREARIRAWRIAKMLPGRMLTVTDLPADYQEARAVERRFLQRIRREGYVLEWAVSHERTKAGVRHLHALCRGDYIPQSVVSREASRSGAGIVADIRRVRNRGGVSYAFKNALQVVGYTTKGDLEAHLDLNGGRLCRTTRGYFKP